MEERYRVLLIDEEGNAITPPSLPAAGVRIYRETSAPGAFEFETSFGKKWSAAQGLPVSYVDLTKPEDN